MLRRVAAELDRYDDAGKLRPSAAPLAASDRPALARTSTPARVDAE